MSDKIITATPITDDTFKVSLYLKGLDGLLEVVGGIFLFVVKPYQLNNLVRTLTQHELSLDPHDFVANHILKTAGQFTTASFIFGALYLLSHGLVKIFLVYEVLRQQLWAYVALIVVTFGFVIYQIYRLTQRLSIGLILLTLFDGLIIYLTQKEYKKRLLVSKIAQTAQPATK